MTINLNDRTNKSIAELATKIMENEPAKVRDFSDIKPIQSDMVQRVMNTGLKNQFIKEATKSVWDNSVDIMAHGDKKPTHTVHLLQSPKGTAGWRGSPRTLKVHVAANDDVEAIQHATTAASHHHDNSHDSERWEKPFVPSNPAMMSHPVQRLKEEQVDEDQAPMYQVKNSATGKVVGTHSYGQGFKPSASSGLKPHPTNIPDGHEIDKSTNLRRLKEEEQIEEERKRGNARHSFQAAQDRSTPRAPDVRRAKGTTNRDKATTNKYARKIAKINPEYKPRDVVAHLKSLEETAEQIDEGSADRLGEIIDAAPSDEHAKKIISRASLANLHHIKHWNMGLSGTRTHKYMKHIDNEIERRYDAMNEEVEQIDEKMKFSGNRRVKAKVFTEKGGKPHTGEYTAIVKNVSLANTPAIHADIRKKAERIIRNHIATNNPGHKITKIDHTGMEHIKEGYRQARTQGTAYGRRDISGNASFKSRELESELGHEENIPHAVYINGKHWKTYPTASHANNIVNSLIRKGKKAAAFVAEDHISDEEIAKREEIVKGMKPVSKWEKRYPGRGEKVMYATATKMAMKEEQLGEEEMNRIIGEAADLDKIAANWDKMSTRAQEALKARHGEELTRVLGSRAVKTTAGQTKHAPKKPETSATVAALANKFSGGEKKGPEPKSKSLADIRAENMRRTKEAQEKGIAHGNAQSRPGGNAGENPDARDKESDLMKSSHEIAGEKATAKGGTTGAIVGGSLKPDKTANKEKPEKEDEKLDEALKGKQNLLDVAAPKGKLTAADFKRLRAMRKGK